MRRKPRTWGEALDAAALRDAAEGGEAHSNGVLLAMLAQVGRPKPLTKALSSQQVVFLGRPKRKAPPVVLFVGGRR